MLLVDTLFALPAVEPPPRGEVFEDAVDLYRAARRAGLTVRSSVDCLIGSCAIRNGLTVLRHDRDFDLLPRIAPLEVRALPI